MTDVSPSASWNTRRDQPRAPGADYAPAIAAPVPFWDQVGRGITTSAEDQFRNRGSGWRQEEWRGELWRRHQTLERLTGQRLRPSAEMVGAEVGDEGGGGLAGVGRAVSNLLDAPERAIFNNPSIDDYEAQVDALRERFPALASLPRREALWVAQDAELSSVRQRASEAAATGLGGTVGSFVGGMGASMADPANIAAMAATGGLGVGRPLLTRMGQQAVANAGVEAIQAPGRSADAETYGGPSYGATDAALDIGFAAVGSAGLEAAGAGGRALLNRLRGAPADPAARGIADRLDQLFADEAVIGPADDFDAARQAMATGAPPPRVEPEQSLDALFAGIEDRPLTAGVSRMQREAPAPGASAGDSLLQPELTSAEYMGRRIHSGRFDPMAVEVDAARFQYKAEGDAEGVTGRLRGVERWDATASGKAILFEDTDGRVIVADGHQRRGLARRLAEQGWEDARLDGYLFRAQDGWSAREVRVVAALKNIREGSGQILDAAKLFREAPGALRDRSLPVTGEFIAQARQLASLSDDGFRAVVNKVIPERYAAIIGEQAADRPELHGDLVDLLRRADPKSAEGARAMVQEGLLDDFIKTEGVQMDLFGGLPRESTLIARGRIREAVMAGLRRDGRLNAALVRNAEAIEAGGNVLARSANEQALAIDRAASELVSRLALRSGEMGEAFGLAASAVTKGETTAGGAAKGLIARIRAAVAAGERLDEVRAEVIAPEPASPAAREAVAEFDAPGGAGQKAQLNGKPEDDFERAAMGAELEFMMAPDGSGRMTWALEPKGVGDADPDMGGINGLSGYIEPNGNWVINVASLPVAARGKGLGVRLYAEAARRAEDAGGRLVSDGRRGTSPDAARVWQALSRQGFEVRRNSAAVVVEEGRLITPSREPVFEVVSIGDRSPGLFDDIPNTTSEDRALSVLRACAPGAA